MIVTIDTGGTKTLVAGFRDDGQPKEIIKFPTPKNVETYIQRVVNQIRLSSVNQSIDIISLALPGVVHDGVAVWCQNLGWHNVPIRDLLSEHFPNVPILVANDANLAGLGAVHRLNNIPSCALYITIGTGVGTSLILNGELNDSLNDCEGGHMMLTYQKKITSWEQIASGRTLYSLFGEISQQSPAEIWQEIAKRLSVGLQPLIAFTQPEVVIIGGILGNFVPCFVNVLNGILAENLPAAIAIPRIIGAPQSEEIVLYGCYDNATKYLKNR